MTMRVVYRKLFRIRVRHGFYANAETHDDFELVPTASTLALMAAASLRVRRHPDGLTVFGEVEPDSDPPTLLRPLGADALRFAFELRAVNRNLLNIAELPGLQPGRSVFCFDNLRQEVDAGRKLLGDSVAGARIGAPARLVTRSVFTHEFGAPVASATIGVFDRFGAELASLDAGSPQAAALLTSYRIDLAAIPKLVPGRYTILDNLGGASAIYYDPGLDASRPLGVIEIYSRTESNTPDHSNRVPPSYRFLSGDALTGLDPYHLQFDALATTWRYIVTKKYDNNGVTLAQLAIDGPLGFAKRMDGTTRAIFISDAAVRFSETPRSLKLKAGNKEIRDLPNPDESIVLGKASVSGSFVADTFVYV
jgi:hypothetical protein